MADEPQGGAGMEDADPFYDEKQIEMNRKVMELAASDPDFRAHIAENTEEALQKAGLLEEAKAAAAEDSEEGEVEGHAWWHATYYRTCRWWQRGYLWHRT